MTGVGMKNDRPRRDWRVARAKVDAALACRGCGGACGRLEAAHVLGREHDYAAPVARVDDLEGALWMPGVVWPTRVIPLGGPATSSTTCHGKQHGKRLDVLPLLTLEEQVQAVADAGGIAQAYNLLVPSENPRRVAAPAPLPLPGDN